MMRIRVVITSTKRNAIMMKMIIIILALRAAPPSLTQINEASRALEKLTVQRKAKHANVFRHDKFDTLWSPHEARLPSAIVISCFKLGFFFF